MSTMSPLEIFDLLSAPLLADRTTQSVDVAQPEQTRLADHSRRDCFGGLKDGTLHFQRCRWCRSPTFRRVFCPACGSPDLELERSSGTGTVSRSLVRRNDAPRKLFTIDMSEGFRLQGSIVGVARHAVWVGSRVRVVADTGTNSGDLTFKLCTASGAN
ncbi:zinc ribbon domain-containing protein [Streptomyces luomodiensis]|uniref:Zinc ribbon domain-containing protein n=1 Tax=Streptomyces luomodiensis TaxID=3026192 RepID=A0ABY9UTY5_9ACTN|nr:zinc ribbon domain-containing protein [Streptomyces sp. SCA4-21]WNE93955.1 zinc ribbon domain-containing protein [Streptomyces sp. SCA4-21]